MTTKRKASDKKVRKQSLAEKKLSSNMQLTTFGRKQAVRIRLMTSRELEGLTGLKRTEAR